MGGVPSKPDYSKSMLVIGAGLSRTGTVSTQLALEKLLGGPVMHGGTHMISREDEYVRKLVYALRASGAGDKELALKYTREVTAGYVGVVDYPMSNLIPILVELYPDAKVVLMTRDREKWWKSMHMILGHVMDKFSTVLVQIQPGLRWMPQLVAEYESTTASLLESVGKKPGDYGPWLIDAHNKMVMDLVPKENLLITDVSQGWEPLCKFLGKPIPDEPFPRANDAAAADETAKRLVRNLMLKWLGIFTILGVSIYGGVQVWKK